MRSLEEIRARLESQKKDRYHSLMWQASEYHPLCIYLKEYLKEGCEPDVLTKESVIAEMQGYIAFAIKKAKEQRGISANRSIWKYQQWLWTLEDPLSDEIAEYDNYGLDHLYVIAEKYGLKTEEES